MRETPQILMLTRKNAKCDCHCRFLVLDRLHRWLSQYRKIRYTLHELLVRNIVHVLDMLLVSTTAAPMVVAAFAYFRNHGRIE